MNDTMRTLQDIVSDVCPPGTPPLDDPDKSFIDYGLDSLDISAVLLACEERFNIKIPDESVEQLATPASLVAHIDAARGT